MAQIIAGIAVVLVVLIAVSIPEYLRRCAACILRPACCQCPAVSWMENGRMDEPLDYYCAAMHSEARWLGVLQESAFGWEVDKIAGSRLACSD